MTTLQSHEQAGSRGRAQWATRPPRRSRHRQHHRNRHSHNNHHTRAARMRARAAHQHVCSACAPATRSYAHAQKDLAEDVHKHVAIVRKGCMGARRVCGGRGVAQTSVRTARAASPSPHPCAARWAQDGASGIIALVRRLGPAGLTGDTLVSYPLDRSYSRWRSWYKSWRPHNEPGRWAWRGLGSRQRARRRRAQRPNTLTSARLRGVRHSSIHPHHVSSAAHDQIQKEGIRVTNVAIRRERL